MDEEKFRKFGTGKMTLKIETETFEIDMSVKERLPVLNLLTANFRTGKTGKNPTPAMIDDVINSFEIAFKRNYPEVDADLIHNFVDLKFDSIITEVAFESGWLKREDMTKAISELEGKKKLSEE